VQNLNIVFGVRKEVPEVKIFVQYRETPY